MPGLFKECDVWELQNITEGLRTGGAQEQSHGKGSRRRGQSWSTFAFLAL